jgi:hypothetical protein
LPIFSRATNALALPLLCATLCAVTCDVMSRVAGRVEDTQGRQYKECTLEVREAASKKIVETRRISGVFRETIRVPKIRADYIASVSCLGARGSFVSDPIRLGARENYDHPVDLGQIVLERE